MSTLRFDWRRCNKGGRFPQRQERQLTRMIPFTCSLAWGAVVPMPTFVSAVPVPAPLMLPKLGNYSV